MRLHTLLPLLPLLALTACNGYDLTKTTASDEVVAKAPTSFKYNHENHVLLISIGSLVATSYPPQGVREYDVTEYKAPYSIATSRPFLFADDIVLTCDVYDEDNVLAGGAGFVIDRAPTGGIVAFKLTHVITDGHIACSAANGKDFTGKAFP